ncbi:ArsR/SmtB family transcription factor [Streptomyces sp. NPDC054796]
MTAKEEPARQVSDPAVLKALAHPLRQKILRRLGTAGPATSTTLAAALGENTGTLSYHLRQLERGGFVEDVTERPGSRERWWRAVSGLDIRRPSPEELTDAERTVMNELDRIRGEEDLRALHLAHRHMLEQSGPVRWVQGSRGLSHLTHEELKDFHDAYLELLARYSRGPEEAPEDARPVLLRWFGVVDDAEEGAAEGTAEEGAAGGGASGRGAGTSTT